MKAQTREPGGDGTKTTPCTSKSPHHGEDRAVFFMAQVNRELKVNLQAAQWMFYGTPGISGFALAR